MKLRAWTLLAAFLLAPLAPQPAAAAAVAAQAAAPEASTQRWTAARAQSWYAHQPWLTGANYIPADAINQLEMWQAATWDPQQIDRELGWAQQQFRMNTMRVFLHDLAYSEDPEGFKRRMDEFLTIAARHGIRPVFVLFDSCWDPDPVIGPQHRPIPGVHNSGWVQSPSRHDLVDRSQEPRLRRYVEDVVGTFAHDERVLAWDLWNEPDNPGGGSYNGAQLAQERSRIEELLPRIFAWARARGPVQPLTSGVWAGDDWSPNSRALSRIQQVQLGQSDVITFHNYELARAVRAADRAAPRLRPALLLHRVDGARQRLHRRHDPADRAAREYRHDQLGLRPGPHPDQPALGQLGAALHAAAAPDLVPRPAAPGRHALSGAGGGAVPESERAGAGGGALSSATRSGGSASLAPSPNPSPPGEGSCRPVARLDDGPGSPPVDRIGSPLSCVPAPKRREDEGES
jgi:hypothetical protein